MPRSRPLPAAALVAVSSLVLAACGGSSAAGPGVAARAVRPTAPPTTSTTVPPTTTTTEQPGWTPVSSVGGAVAVDERTVTAADGTSVVLVRFRAGRVRFDLHVGSSDPSDPSAPPDAAPQISAPEQAALLGAFNGGFQTSTGSGGFEVGGTVLVPLRPGLASFVIDTDGSAHVGVWGSQLPAPGEQVASVRQNLPPLVSGSAPAADVGVVSDWGATLGGVSVIARSAVGQDAAGDIVYAASMHALPGDLADALVSVGVTTAMELDINPEWVQAVVTQAPGGAPVAAVPGQSRPADQLQVGWTRDFVVAVAP